MIHKAKLFVQIFNLKALGLIIKKSPRPFQSMYLRNKYGKKIKCKISRLTRKYCIIYNIPLYCNYKRK